MAYYAVLIIHTVWHLLRMMFFILVADAGSPYVHIYEKDVSEWRGVRSPIYSSRVLSDEIFSADGTAMAVQKVVQGVSILTIL